MIQAPFDKRRPCLECSRTKTEGVYFERKIRFIRSVKAKGSTSLRHFQQFLEGIFTSVCYQLIFERKMVLDKKMPQGQINIKHELFFFLFSTQINISRKTGGKYVVH